jgi:hypothetical protein
MTTDINEIKKTLSILFHPGDVVELRALGVQGRIHAGYFDDFERLAIEAARLSGQADGVYVVLNEINKALLARSQNRITISPKNLTQDKDITRRRYLPFDIDANRPAGISSTDNEHEAAFTTAKQIRTYLIEQMNFPSDSIIMGDSGNGAHILIHIDLPNDSESEELIKTCLKAVAVKFNNNSATVDQTVFNAARIWKLYGTLACKGDNTKERPHRTAKIEDLII